MFLCDQHVRLFIHNRGRVLHSFNYSFWHGFAIIMSATPSLYTSPPTTAWDNISLVHWIIIHAFSFNGIYLNFKRAKFNSARASTLPFSICFGSFELFAIDEIVSPHRIKKEGRATFPILAVLSFNEIARRFLFSIFSHDWQIFSNYSYAKNRKDFYDNDEWAYI